MASQSNRRHLFLMEGDHGCSRLLYDTHISQIPSNLTIILFSCERDQDGRELFRDFRDTSQIQLRRSPRPVTELFDTIRRELDHYTCIHIICDTTTTYWKELLKMSKLHKHVYLMEIEPSGITLQSILNRGDGYDEGIGGLSPAVPARQTAIGYQCFICLATFDFRNDLEKHDRECHRTDANDVEEIDEIAKNQPTGKTKSTDLCHDECFCVKCRKRFRNTKYRANHIQIEHPDAEFIDNQE